MKRKIIIVLSVIAIMVACSIPAFAEPLYFSDWTNDTIIENGVATRLYYPTLEAYWEVQSRNISTFGGLSEIETTLRAGYNTYVTLYPFGQKREIPLEAFKSGSTLSLEFQYGLRYFGTAEFDLDVFIRYYDKEMNLIKTQQGDSFFLADEEAIDIPVLLDIPSDAVWMRIEFFMSNSTPIETNEVVIFELYDAEFLWTYNVADQSAANGEQILSAMDKLMYGYEYENYGSIFDDVSQAEGYVWDYVSDQDVFLEDTVLNFTDILYTYESAFIFVSTVVEMFMVVDIYRILITVSLALGSFALLLGALSVFTRRE